MSNPVVSDRLRYGLKPVAVESKQSVITIPALGSTVYSGDTSSNIVFRIQHNPSGRYVDPAATRIKMTFTLDFTGCTTPALTPLDTILFERGPESIIRRFQIRDIQQRILEDIDNYNSLYAVTELCTANTEIRNNRGGFHHEGNPMDPALGGFIKHPAAAYIAQNQFDTYAANTWQGPATAFQLSSVTPGKITFDMVFTPTSAVFGSSCDKYIPLSVMEGMEVSLQLEDITNALLYHLLIPPSNPLNISSRPIPNIQNTIGRKNRSVRRGGIATDDLYAEFVAGTDYGVAPHDCAAELANLYGAFQGVAQAAAVVPVSWNNRYKFYQANSNFLSNLKYTISNPKMLLDCLDVSPNVNDELIRAAKDPRDGMIRIQTHSWMVLSNQITPGAYGNWSWTIPISVTSLKSIFFTFSNVSNKNNLNFLNSGFEHRGLLNYRFLIGGVPVNADYIEVKPPYGEALSALYQAWGVNIKTDACPGLIKVENYSNYEFGGQHNMWTTPSNVVFGQELESFNQKSGLIQSGINTMQTTFVLECNFDKNSELNLQTCATAPAAGGDPSTLSCKKQMWHPTAQYEIRAYCMYDKIIAFDETAGSIRSEY
jgi:hypothetical protein